MTMLGRLIALVTVFSIATVAAEAGLLAVLWQRGMLQKQTLQNVLAVAYDVPVRDMYDQLLAKVQPVKKEMVSFAEVQEARMMTSLDLDLREMCADKGLRDLRELHVLLDQETGRYQIVKDRFDQQWNNLQKGASQTDLKDLQHQIESLHPKAAKDQLLRILDSPDLDTDKALTQVVTIFKSMPIEKRKKIVAEFKETDSQRLQDILRQIRLGMPEVDLLRETRTRLEALRIQQ